MREAGLNDPLYVCEDLGVGLWMLRRRRGQLRSDISRAVLTADRKRVHSLMKVGQPFNEANTFAP